MLLRCARWGLSLGIAGLLVMPLAVSAGDSRQGALAVQAPQKPVLFPVGGGWDDSHMRSNFHRSRGGPATRLPIQGSSGYGAMLAGTSETRIEVPEALESATQRDWEQGPLSEPRPAPKKPPSPRTTQIVRGSTRRGGVSASR